MGAKSNHDLSGAKEDTPLSTLPDNTLFTSERSTTDYFTLAGVCKRTGTTEKELAVFGLKEIIDNGLDFSEAYVPSSFNGDPEIFVSVTYEREIKNIVIKIRNSNFGLKDLGFTEKRIHAIFENLDKFHSSKRNLFKINRGLQGDAMKEVVGIPKVLGSNWNGNKGWNEPVIIRNGAGEEFEIRAIVDKIGGRNYCTIL